MRLGWSNFYTRTLSEYAKYRLSNIYATFGTLEYETDMTAVNRIGYFMTEASYNGVKFNVYNVKGRVL